MDTSKLVASNTILVVITTFWTILKTKIWFVNEKSSDRRCCVL